MKSEISQPKGRFREAKKESLDNNGTFQHFDPFSEKIEISKQNYYSVHNRVKSLRLSDLFESSAITRKAIQKYVQGIIKSGVIFIPEKHIPFIFELLRKKEKEDNYKVNKSSRKKLSNRLDVLKARIKDVEAKLEDIDLLLIKPSKRKKKKLLLLKKAKGIKSEISRIEKEVRELESVSTLTVEEEKFLVLYRRVIRMRFCSRLAAFQFKGKKYNIHEKSANCEDSACFICNRAKSAKLYNRLMNCLNDEEIKIKTKGYHFYFVTLTVRHDKFKNVRAGNYLTEFRAYQNKLFRRDLWRKNFTGGQITHIENSIKDDYHIHSHSLILAPKLAGKRFQSDLKEEWEDITKDSFQVDFKDLGSPDLNSVEFKSTVQELMKYSTKTSVKFDKMPRDNKEILASWFAETAGKNMFMSYGLFRGQQITSKKSKYDTGEKPVKEFDEESFYYIDKLGAQTGNIDLSKDYDKKKKKKILENGVWVDELSGEQVDLTDLKHHISDVISTCSNLEEVRDVVENVRLANSIEGLWSDDPLLNKRVKLMNRQSVIGSNNP